MTATFAPATPRIGDLVAVAPGQPVTTPTGDRTWKAAFRMRVTAVNTPDDQRRVRLAIVGGVVVNKDGSDRIHRGNGAATRAVECAFTFTPDRVTLVTPAQPTSTDIYRAYARQAAMTDAPTPRAYVPDVPAVDQVNAPVTADQGAYVAGPMASDVDRDLVARMEANARRTADETADAFLSVADRGVTVHRITTYDQVLTSGIDDDDTVISYRPRIKAESGTVTDINVRGQSVTVTLTSVTADETYAWTHTVGLVGSDHPMGNATPYAIDVHQGDAPTSADAKGADGPGVCPDSVKGAPVAEAGDQGEPVVIEYPADVMAEARTLRMGDRVSGRTSDRKHFAGYLCADPADGRDQAGNPAVVIMLGSSPVEGSGGRWCLTGTARFARLPADPAVVAEGETISAMRAMRRAGYTVTGARCGRLTAHHAHIYRRPEAPDRTRFACRGWLIDMVDAPDEGADEMRAAYAAIASRDAADQGATDAPAPAPVPVPAPAPAPAPVTPVATVAPVTTESEAPMPAPVQTEAASVPAGHLVATIDRAVLVDALAHLVKFAPVRGAAPEYAALTVAADRGDQVTMSVREFDALVTVTLPASVAVTGSVMINARALVKLIKATPAPRGRKATPTMVTLAHQGDQVTITAGATALVADAVYPTLNLGPVPVVPVAPVQTASTPDFTDAVTRVIVAAGTDDTMPVLTGVQVTTTREGDLLRMLTCDRYRAVDVTMPARYCLDSDTDAREHVTAGLVPARFLGLVGTVAGKSGADTVGLTTFAHQGDAWHGYRVGRYVFALRTITGELPNVRAYFDQATTAHVFANGVALAAMIERVATGAGPADPVKLTVAADADGNVTGVTAYLIKNSARESMPATGRAADGFSVGVNPAYASAALCGVIGEATVSFVDNRTPVIIAGEPSCYRALVMPVRLDGSTCDQAAPTGQTAEAASVAEPVDVRTADQVTTAGDALVTVHGVNGHRAPITLTGTVKHMTTCLTGRVAGLVRVQLDSGRTIYVSVTATTKEDTMTTTDQTTDQRNAAEEIAGRAFTLMTGGQFAEARAAMAEAAALVPADHKYGRKHELSAVLAIIDAAEAAATPAPVAPVVAESTGVELSPITVDVTETAPTSDDTAARVRDALSRVTWQGATVDGRGVDLMVLPAVPRVVYLAIKAVVGPIGGTYARKSGARPGGFAFAPSRVIHSTGGFTATGREKVTAWLSGSEVPTEAPEAPAPAPVAEAAPVTPVATANDVDAAYARGYAEALATMTSATPAPAPAPVPAPATEASTTTFTLPDYDLTGEVYGASVAAIAERLAGHKGVTVKRVARKGPDRRKFTVAGPASAHAIAAAYVKALESRTVKA